MDPYHQPNPYGYAPPYGPPPGYGGMRPPPAPYGAGGYMPPGRPPMHPMPGAASMIHGQPGAAGTTDNGKLTTLFIGAIAPGISDAWIEKLLRACGALRQWKRMKDPSGNPKGFGFAEYEDPDSVLRTLRVLGGENGTHEGLTLTAMDGSQVQKKLIVKADDNVRNYLNQYQSGRMEASTDEDKDKAALDKVYAYVEAINAGKEPEEEEDGQAEAKTTTGPDETGTATKDDEEMQEDLISKELAIFKERAAQRDQERQRLREEQAEGQDNKRYESPERDERRRPQRGKRQDFVRGPVEHGTVPDDEDISDEELERRKIQKHEKDVERAFRQREARLEDRENARWRNYERDLMREKEEDERRARDREYWAKRLAEFDDEVEMERGEVDFYANRSRWRKRREAIRRMLDEQDEKDRRLEAEELEEERRRAEDLERLQKERRSARAAEEAPKIALKPTKLNFNISIKRISAMGSADEEDEDEEGGRKRRVLVPLDYGEDLALDDSSHMDPEERLRRIKELIDSIPSSEQELWSWSVRWDQLDEDLLDTKLKPFVSKKIAELTGSEEEELINFILDFVKQREAPDSLVKELEMVLDTEALVFVMKLWRALIFETERKYRKL